MTSDVPEKPLPVVGSTRHGEGAPYGFRATGTFRPRRLARTLLSQLAWNRRAGIMPTQEIHLRVPMPAIAVGPIRRFWRGRLIDELEHGLARDGFRIERVVVAAGTREVHIDARKAS